MFPGTIRRWGGVLAALAVLPGVAAAQPVDPSSVTEAPVAARALGSFALVGLVGAGVLARHGHFVDRAVDDTMARPSVAVLYGLMAYVFVVFVGFYANDVLTRVGVAGTPLGYLALAVLVGGVLVLGGLGYAIVGTLLTDLHGVRRPRQGVVLGAALSAVGWLVLPVLWAFAAWVLVAAFGVGGPTRTWFHSERTVGTELDD